MFAARGDSGGRTETGDGYLFGRRIGAPIGSFSSPAFSPRVSRKRDPSLLDELQIPNRSLDIIGPGLYGSPHHQRPE